MVASDAPVDAISSISPRVSSLESIFIIIGSFGGLMRMAGSRGGRGGRNDISDLGTPFWDSLESLLGTPFWDSLEFLFLCLESMLGTPFFWLLGLEEDFVGLEGDEFFRLFEGWSLFWVCLFGMFYWGC